MILWNNQCYIYKCSLNNLNSQFPIQISMDTVEKAPLME